MNSVNIYPVNVCNDLYKMWQSTAPPYISVQPDFYKQLSYVSNCQMAQLEQRPSKEPEHSIRSRTDLKCQQQINIYIHEQFLGT